MTPTEQVCNYFRMIEELVDLYPEMIDAKSDDAMWAYNNYLTAVNDLRPHLVEVE
jgi:hypothetical protein